MATKSLYRRDDDRIECRDHAPRRGTAAYREGGWLRMNALQLVHARAVLLQECLIGWDDPLCETCRRNARPARRRA